MQLVDTMMIVGCDEVGRGCLFGDVVSAAVILPEAEDFPDNTWMQIKDSKKLTAKKRAMLCEYIQRHAIAWGIGKASAQEIDESNILQATMAAMHRAIDDLCSRYDGPITKLMIDGNYFKKYKNIPHETVIQGDAKVVAIAAASIVAKHTRDMDVLNLLANNPTWECYGLRTNMGYGTKAHCEALAQYGPTMEHRRSFAKVLSKNE